MKRAVIYTRISQARSDSSGRKTDDGVTRQREDCLELAQQRGWEVVDVLEDNDFSAFSGKRRPDYERLLQGLREDRYDVIVAWDSDRLWRRPVELEQLVELIDGHRVEVATIKSGELDLATSGGRLHARVLGAFARHESEHKGERVARARRQEAERGQMHGPLGFGWRKEPTGTWVIHEPEAEIVRDIVARLLTGSDSLANIARDLNGRGVPTPTGRGLWRGANIRQMVVAARFCGWREYTPRSGSQSKPRGFGELVAEGDWPKILTREDTESVRRLLADPSRSQVRGQTELLVGLLICGRCGAKLSTAHLKQDRPFRYRCCQQPGTTRCGGTSISGPALDALVGGMVLTVLKATSGARPAVRTDSQFEDLRASLVANAERRNELAELWAAGRLQVSEWLAARDLLEQEAASVEQEMSSLGRDLHPRLSAKERRELARDWADFTVEKQRRICRDLIRSIRVLPATSRSPKFDPLRVIDSIDWRI